MAETSPATLGVMLVSADHARLLAGLTLAAGGLAIGRPVRLFATGPGLCALRADYAPPEDAALRARGLAGVLTLRAACVELRAELIACDSAMHAAGLDATHLCAGACIGGIVGLLEGGVTPTAF